MANRKIPKLNINEMFSSIQGEGVLAGLKTFFVRTQGCSVGCAFCDSKNTWSKADKNSSLISTDVLNTIKNNTDKLDRICFTGGEPMEQIKSIEWIISKLYRVGYRKISIETSGTPLPDKLTLTNLFLSNVFFSVNPKLKSALRNRFDFDFLLNTYRYWDNEIYVPYRLQYKFVVSNEDDLIILNKLFSYLKTKHYLFLQIEASKVSDSEFIDKCVEYLNKDSFKDVRMTIQQHVVMGIR